MTERQGKPDDQNQPEATQEVLLPVTSREWGRARRSVERAFGHGAVGELPRAGEPHAEQRALDIIESLVTTTRILATEVDTLRGEVGRLKRG